MINLDKPDVATLETNLNIGDGFNLLVGSTFRLIIGALGLGGMTNVAKTSVGETWESIQLTWVTESRTWLAVSKLIDNVVKAVTSITNFNKP